VVGVHVILDYVRPVAARGPALVVLATGLLAVAAWIARILLLAQG
jgi:hypothetical protein